MLSRRNLMRMSASAGVLAIAGCSSLATTPSQLQQDAAALIKFATGALQTSLSAAGIAIPANVLGDFQTALNGVAANAGELLDSLGNGNEPILQRIMEGLSVVANVLTPFFPAAGVAFPLFQLLVSAAVSLVQGLIASFKPAAAAQSLMAAPAIGGGKLVPMTMGAARQTLGG